MPTNLTQREIEIIKHVADGYGSKQIAHKLSISKRTVETHRKNIKRKLGARNFYSVLSLAFREGILDMEESKSA